MPTDSNKQRISLDGLTNAVTGQNMFLEDHEYPAYMSLGVQYMAELRPVGVRETQLAQKIIDLNWRLNTLSAVENNLFHSSRIAVIVEGDPSDDKVVGMTSKAAAWRQDCEGPNSFEKLGRHEMRVQRTLTRLTAELERFQSQRYKKGDDAFVLAACEAWVWYERMFARYGQMAAERSSAVDAETSQAASGESATSAESASSDRELLCKKASEPVADPLLAAAVPLLRYAAAHGLLDASQQQMLASCKLPQL